MTDLSQTEPSQTEPSVSMVRKSDVGRAIAYMRRAATDMGAAASLLKTSHPATSRALLRSVDRLTRQRHKLEDGHV